MDIFTATTLTLFQPSFRSKNVGIFTVLLHGARDNRWKYHLDAGWNVIATNDHVLLQCTTISNNCTINSANTKMKIQS